MTFTQRILGFLGFGQNQPDLRSDYRALQKDSSTPQQDKPAASPPAAHPPILHRQFAPSLRQAQKQPRSRTADDDTLLTTGLSLMALNNAATISGPAAKASDNHAPTVSAPDCAPASSVTTTDFGGGFSGGGDSGCSFAPQMA